MNIIIAYLFLDSFVRKKLYQLFLDLSQDKWKGIFNLSWIKWDQLRPVRHDISTPLPMQHRAR